MILVDTHVVIWLALDPPRISKNAREAIEQARHNGSGLAISDMTLLEIARLSSEGHIHLNTSLESFLLEIERRFIVLPMTGRICLQAMALPKSYPKDPADRVIAATAMVDRISLLTADREIRSSRAVPTIW